MERRNLLKLLPLAALAPILGNASKLSSSVSFAPSLHSKDELADQVLKKSGADQLLRHNQEQFFSDLRENMPKASIEKVAELNPQGPYWKNFEERSRLFVESKFSEVRTLAKSQLAHSYSSSELRELLAALESPAMQKFVSDRHFNSLFKEAYSDCWKKMVSDLQAETSYLS